ncbi:MAG TPA: RecX family transcriptional regulator [Solirubrobacteraceae bacterium]|nr:RecX family transcriptional regulator [Solirubrobacteraceae bacterium]
MNLEAAKALGYAYLGRRERTTHEMREHLLARGADERVVAATLLELTEEGYLDDRRFARLFAEDKRNLSGWGTARIRRALMNHGVVADLVDSALQDADSGADELKRALSVLRRRFPAPPATARDRGRALGVLMRKGYDYELAVEALGEHLRQAREAVAPTRPRY